MMKLRNATAAAVAAALAGLAGQAAAGGFAIGVQSGSATGNAVAGGAAVAEDASVVWSNPAAMTALQTKREFTTALHILKPSFQFRNEGSTGTFAAAGSGEGGDGGDWAYVPNMFYSAELAPNVRYGFAVNVPFGLKTGYEAGWRGQFIGLDSKLETINLNASIAYKFNEMWSVGAGANAQRLKAEFSAATPSPLTGNLNIGMDSWGFGVNVGATFTPAPGTRFGATYRAPISYRLEGRSHFTGTLAGALESSVSGDVSTPASASFSALHALTSKWDIMGDVTWTGWKEVQQLIVVRTSSTIAGASGTNLTALPFQWRNTWRFSVGANFKASDTLKFRMGVAYDETPTSDAFRSPRLPDENRKWAAVGVQYKPWRNGTFDVGYAHEFIRDAKVTNFNAAPAGTLVGSFDAKADIISLQYSHAF
jgi:long-chain fatty acid transport protein